jgi:adenosylcobinamide-phosphate synthase
MTFISILCALLIEQLKPLRADNPAYAAIHALTVRMETWFNAGQENQGRLAWIVMMLILIVPTLVLYWLCTQISPFAVFLFNTLVTYLTLGFRHYSHYFSSIQFALSNGDVVEARRLLGEWTKQDTSGMEVGEISRIAVENALVTTHRNVFGVFFWFLMPIGPAGAILYRVADHLARVWNEPEHMKNEAFGRFAAKAFYWIDWIPVRLTAIAFAVVGNFEDAIYAWRNFADRWSDEAIGIILAAGGGAMGLRLGAANQAATKIVPADAIVIDGASGMETVETLPGEEPTARALQSTVGLAWRALLLWMLLLLLLSLAVWLG